MAESALQLVNAEVARLAGDPASNSTSRLDRLVDLQGQSQAAEHRLTELAAERRELEADQIDEAHALRALDEFNPVWKALTTREQIRLIQMLVAKIGYDGRTGKVTVDFKSAGIKDLCNGATKTA